MPAQTFEHRDPEKLKNHPINASIYGSAPDEEYIASVKEHGITEPLIITPGNVVISGHRRRQAAIMCGIKQVDVIVLHELTNPLLIERRLILANRHREKTTEQRAREFENLKRIESELAEQRMKSTLKKGDSPAMPNLAQRENAEKTPKKGAARKLAAEAVGMKPTTAEAAVEVVHAIDEAEAKGETERAADLRDTLNNKSVSAAAAKVKPPKPKPSKPKFDDEIVEKGIRTLVQALDSRSEVHGKTTGHSRCIDAMNDFVKEWKNWKAGA